jgi:hypothetical protein
MKSTALLRAALAAGTMLCMQSAGAAVSAPEWMRAQVSAPVPAHDEDTDAVLLYSDVALSVQAPGKMKRTSRFAYRVLRRDGAVYGTVRADYTPMNRITALRAWSIPATGKDYEVKQKDIVETGITDVDGGELVSDVRRKILVIPAATPGSIVGYEIEQELQPYEMTDDWDFQDTIPVRESHYSVTLPPGWTYKVFWINYPETAPAQSTPGASSWTLNDLKPVKLESNMPPWRGIAGRMEISLQPPDGKQGGFQSWKDVGNWYLGLANGRRDISAGIRAKVQEITRDAPTQLAKMQALAAFVQKDIRYVAIELGVGGVQPHAATDIFSNRYGDCKDKATLLSSMLKEIGVESHYVIINTERGAVDETTSPNLGFNHAIMAIALPETMNDPSLLAVAERPGVGRVLFFDPTDAYTPLGRIRGELQANYGLLVAGSASALMPLPQLPTASSYVQRTARLKLSAEGDLSGDMQDVRLGDSAARARAGLRSSLETDRIRPVETLLADSLSSFQLTQASVVNLSSHEQPFEWRYKFEAPRYAKRNADFLLLRPWVLGSRSSSLLETREARQHPIEFEGPAQYRDSFDIELPEGYEIDALPDPTRLDIGVATYESKTELSGRVLRYSRVLEIKELSVPASNAEQLKKFYRNIFGDERRVVALKRLAH